MVKSNYFFRFFAGLALAMMLLAPQMLRAAEETPVPKPFSMAISADSINWDDTLDYPKADYGRNSRQDVILWALGIQDYVRFMGGHSWPGGGAKCVRLVLNQPTKIGTILMGANGNSLLTTKISILKPDAELPGDVENDELWEVLKPNAEQAGAVVYTLPVKTKVRALRINGNASALRLLSERYVNITSSSVTLASLGNSNGIPKDMPWNVRAPEDITVDNPQWIVLSWKQPQAIQAVFLTSPFFKQYALDAYKGEPTNDYAEVKDTDWKAYRTEEKLQVPFRYAQNILVNLGKTVTTSAVRLRVLLPWKDENSDIKAGTGNSSQVAGLRGFVVLKDIGNAPYPEEKKDDTKTTAPKPNTENK